MAETTALSGGAAIMLGVRDLPEAVEFYRDKLGLKVVMNEPGLALLQCGNMMIGLNPGLVRMAPQVAGATEVSFRVDNLRTAHQALAEKGVTFLSEPRQATPTDLVVHFKDLDGHLLSLFGPDGKA